MDLKGKMWELEDEMQEKTENIVTTLSPKNDAKDKYKAEIKFIQDNFNVEMKIMRDTFDSENQKRDDALMIENKFMQDKFNTEIKIMRDVFKHEIANIKDTYDQNLKYETCLDQLAQCSATILKTLPRDGGRVTMTMIIPSNNTIIQRC